MELSLAVLRDAMALQFMQVASLTLAEATAYIDSQIETARAIYLARGAPFGDDDAGLARYLTDGPPEHDTV